MDIQLPVKKFTEDRGSATILKHHESIFSFLSEEVNQTTRLKKGGIQIMTYTEQIGIYRGKKSTLLRGSMLIQLTS
jgi:hypothetical protein